MLKIQDIKELIRLIDKSSVDELKLEEDGTKLVIRRNKGLGQSIPMDQGVQAVSAPQPIQAPVSTQPTTPAVQVEEKSTKETPENESLHKITSPMVGTFYSAPSPDSDPYVKTGDKLQADSVVCIVEAMKLMNEIEAETSGTIVEILVENGQLVEYGQPLFLVKTE